MAGKGKGGAKKTGDWAKVKRLTAGMPERFRKVIKNTLPKIGLKGERIAVLHIRNQDLGWEPLNSKYLERKIEEGKSEKTLIADAEYIRNISSYPANMNVLIGVDKKVKTKDGKETIADVAKTHEYGSEAQGIPARPLWRPTYQEILKWLKESKIFAVEIAKDLKRR